MKKTLTISATISAFGISAAIALAGCAGTSGSTPTNTMPGKGSAGMGMASSSAPATADHNAADTMFTQGMIPHHAQAVEMSDMMLRKQGMDARITALATKIKAAQAPEIAQMTGWLKTWNEPTQMASGHGMGSKLSERISEKADIYTFLITELGASTARWLPPPSPALQK